MIRRVASGVSGDDLVKGGWKRKNYRKAQSVRGAKAGGYSSHYDRIGWTAPFGNGVSFAGRDETYLASVERGAKAGFTKVMVVGSGTRRKDGKADSSSTGKKCTG